MSQTNISSEQAQLNHLVHMANQIALNMAPMGSKESCADRVHEHIVKYWAKPMRQQIMLALDGIEPELEPVALEALRKLA